MSVKQKLSQSHITDKKAKISRSARAHRSGNRTASDSHFSLALCARVCAYVNLRAPCKYEYAFPGVHEKAQWSARVEPARPCTRIGKAGNRQVSLFKDQQ